jgi:hypothetical protein
MLLTAGMHKEDGATSAEVGRKLEIDQSAAYRRMLVAERKGLVVNLETRRRRQGSYRVIEGGCEKKSLLPSVDDLKEAASTPLESAHTCIPIDQPAENTDETVCTEVCKPVCEDGDGNAYGMQYANGHEPKAYSHAYRSGNNINGLSHTYACMRGNLGGKSGDAGDCDAEDVPGTEDGPCAERVLYDEMVASLARQGTPLAEAKRMDSEYFLAGADAAAPADADDDLGKIPPGLDRRQNRNQHQ